MSRPKPWPTSLKVFWLIAGTFIVLMWGTALGYRLQVKPGQLHDYSQDWCSARNYFSDQPIYLSLDESVPLYFGGAYHGGIKRNAHPPPTVLMSLPFARLDYPRAMFAWNVFSLCLLAPTFWMILRGLKLNGWLAVPMICIVLMSNALAQQVNQGQWNLVLLFLLTAAWAAQRERHDAWSGAALGLAICVKLIPAFLLLYFLIQRRWIAIVSAATTVAVLMLASGLVLGWSSISDYAFHVLPSVDKFRDFWPNASLAGLWAKLFDGSSGRVIPVIKAPWLSHLLTLITSLAVVGYTAWLTLRARTSPQRDLAWAAATIAMMLVSPVTWDHYFLMLALPFSILWQQSPHWGGRGMVIWAAYALIVLNAKRVWDRWIPGDGEVIFSPDQTPSIATPLQVLTVISYPVYTLCLLLFVTGWWVVRTGSEDPEVESA